MSLNYILSFVNFFKNIFNGTPLSFINERDLEENKVYFNRTGTIISKQPTNCSIRASKISKINPNNKVIIEYKNGEYLIGEKLFKDNEYNERKTI